MKSYYLKQQSLFARQGANEKLYPSPNPYLKLNPNCNPNLNPNSKSKLQQTTNDNNLKNKSVFEQMSTHFFLYAELICTLECK